MDLFGQAATGGQAAGNSTGMFGPPIMIALMVAIFYFILIRPARKQQKEHQNLISSLKGGERIITAGGIYGTITRVMEDRVEVEVDKNIKIQVAKTSIARVINLEDGAAPKKES